PLPLARGTVRGRGRQSQGPKYIAPRDGPGVALDFGRARLYNSLVRRVDTRLAAGRVTSARTKEGAVSELQPDLTLAEARAIIDRAGAKARELYQAGAFVVMAAGGNVVSASVIEGAITSSVWITRAKAYVAAVQQEPSARRAGAWQKNP